MGRRLGKGIYRSTRTNGTKYSKMGQVKFMDDSL